jgi:hypothetical protein
VRASESRASSERARSGGRSRFESIPAWAPTASCFGKLRSAFSLSRKKSSVQKMAAHAATDAPARNRVLTFGAPCRVCRQPLPTTCRPGASCLNLWAGPATVDGRSVLRDRYRAHGVVDRDAGNCASGQIPRHYDGTGSVGESCAWLASFYRRRALRVLITISLRVALFQKIGSHGNADSSYGRSFCDCPGFCLAGGADSHSDLWINRCEKRLTHILTTLNRGALLSSRQRDEQGARDSDKGDERD